MAITITPNLPSVAATAPSAPASGIALQAGQVITAEVLQVLGNNQVQIAIGNQTIEATTQVPLQVGQTLQLQVSQTSGGIGLAIVNQPSTGGSQAGAGVAATSNPVITLSPSLAASLAANVTANAVTPANPLTPLETLAVSVAAQTAVTQQTSLAPLFADLNVAVGLPNLPPQIQQAVAQVLAQQTTLDPNLTGEAVQQAFQSSGILLEASLASGSAATPGVIPDLKAALIVLRQALTSALPDGTVTSGAATTTSAPATASTPQAAASQAAATTEATPSGTSTSGAAPQEPAISGSVPTPAAANTAQPATVLTAAVLAETSELLAQAGALPAAAVAQGAPQEILSALLTAAPTAVAASTASSSAPAIAQQVLELAAGSATLAPAASSADAAVRAAAASAALNLLQEVLQASPVVAGSVSNMALQSSQLLSLLPVVTGTRTAAGVDDADFARTSIPPPPINGALPSAQPVAPATLAAHVPVEAAMQHLLDDTDGAIARQTLLQIASLPGQVDPSASRIDASAPRWNFEIPFLTPQGTAMAQFEISRDGGREATSAKATWRARFSLNVEPAGPVHALVSLNGDRTSVKMWAERPSTATQLRAGVSQLSQALSRAELTPGDIVIRDGAPQQPAAAPAGHFLDRAS
jgi:hypothetical protein